MKLKRKDANANGAQNKLAENVNIRGRRGIAEAGAMTTAGFFTPFVLILPTGAPGTPKPIGRPSRAADAS